MSRKKCRRKHYTLVNCVTHAIEGARVADDKLLNSVRLLELSAIEAFRTGSATRADWQTVVDMLNICETMARGGVGPEAIPACEAAQAELIGAAKRYESTKRMGVTGPGLTTLREVFEYHDLQRQSISRSRYAEFIDRTKKAITHRHAGVVELRESLVE